MNDNYYQDRKTYRLPGYDYSHGGYYMITMRTQGRIEYFGKINNERMELNQCGLIVNQIWQWLPQQYPYVSLDEYIIMPNHFHGIVYIDQEQRWAARVPPLPRMVNSLSRVMAAFKVRTSKLIHQSGLLEFKWQRSFYDNIIRNGMQLENFRRYIRENPTKWWRDRSNLK